jgi:hypothetical protein
VEANIVQKWGLELALLLELILWLRGIGIKTFLVTGEEEIGGGIH